MIIQVAAEPLDQTVSQYGPFVMTTREEIQKTLRDCEQSFILAARDELTPPFPSRPNGHERV